MPLAMLAGCSYSDFWQMTFGEIQKFLEVASTKAKNEAHNALVNSAFTAYYGGAYSRENVQLPRKLQTAFPALFGYTKDGQIDIEANADEAERAMEYWYKRFNQKAVNE